MDKLERSQQRSRGLVLTSTRSTRRFQHSLLYLFKWDTVQNKALNLQDYTSDKQFCLNVQILSLLSCSHDPLSLHFLLFLFSGYWNFSQVVLSLGLNWEDPSISFLLEEKKHFKREKPCTKR